MMNVVIAPSGFKESMSAEQTADAIAQGVLRAYPEAHVVCAPLVDGGEGFTQTLIHATGGELHPVTVTGPVGRPVEAHFGVMGGIGPRTAVLEMASAAGLRLVPRDQRNPLATTSYGVGELIRAALSVQPQRILIGCGDSGINDGGAGMAQALGVSLLDARKREIWRGCSALSSLERIDLNGLERRLKGVHLDVACNPYNVLCGPNGVARVFGPQKGATPVMVEAMSAAMERYAQAIEQQFGVDMRDFPGGGASGGLGTGLHVLLGAQLHSRYDIVMRYLRLDDLLQKADLVITAEGGIDGQTPRGKIPAEVARRAKRFGVPVIALAGTVGQGAHENYAHGIAAYTSVLQAPCTLEEAIQHAQRLTTEAAESAMRMVMVGRRLTHYILGSTSATNPNMPIAMSSSPDSRPIKA